MKRVFVGIDPSLSSTGFVRITYPYPSNNGGRIISSSCITTKPKQFDSPYSRVDYICQAVKKYLTFDREVEIIACIESPLVVHPGNSLILGALGFALRSQLFFSNVPFFSPTATQVKKFATGKGNAAKEDIIKAVREKWRFRTRSSDLADACVMAKMAEANRAFNTEDRELISRFSREEANIIMDMEFCESGNLPWLEEAYAKQRKKGKK